LAEARYTTTTRVPADRVWEFVQEMDHWAPFVMGYQSHEKQSDTESTWTLKGDLGVMSRTLTFAVLITEWNGPSQVRFTLRGLNEPMTGEGAFTIEPATSEAQAGLGRGVEDGREAAADPPPQTRPREGLLARWLRTLTRWLFRLVAGRVDRETPPSIASGGAASRLSFELRIDPGGPMAPMVDAMIKPLLLPAAEQLADRILAHLEGRAEGAPR
jgi:carbon monoxide dehydrogenase subunit G